MTPADLAARIEAADESQTWEMLKTAFLRRHPTLASNQKGYGEWFMAWQGFEHLYRSNAPYDVARMLVGDGWKPSRIVWLDDAVEFSMRKGFASATGRHRTSMPLAIAAAAVRANNG